jgi:hypothetical protein
MKGGPASAAALGRCQSHGEQPRTGSEELGSRRGVRHYRITVGCAAALGLEPPVRHARSAAGLYAAAAVRCQCYAAAVHESGA